MSVTSFWIATKFDRPEPHRTVFLRVHTGYITTGVWDDTVGGVGAWRYVGPEGWHCYWSSDVVTHWMPIPPLPDRANNGMKE